MSRIDIAARQDNAARAGDQGPGLCIGKACRVGGVVAGFRGAIQALVLIAKVVHRLLERLLLR